MLVLAASGCAVSFPAAAKVRVVEERVHAIVDLPRERALVVQGQQSGEGDAEAPRPVLAVTRIDRKWVHDGFESRESGRVDPGGIERSETVVLVGSRARSFDRLRWRKVFDHRTGESEFDLTAWNDGGEVLDLGMLLQSTPAGTEAEASDEPHPDSDVYCRVTAEGRLWAMPLDLWRLGELSAVDRAALSDSVGPEELAVLREIRPLTLGFPSMRIACDVFVQPLLEPGTDDVGYCIPTSSVRVRRRPLDCTFDASFGEPCSPEQLRRQKRELADQCGDSGGARAWEVRPGSPRQRW